ncbi:MAG: hypothetical protein Q4A11_03280 [Brachymonas sp.]|nr:hypothetical protein [Brachymonas sp.]
MRRRSNASVSGASLRSCLRKPGGIYAGKKQKSEFIQTKFHIHTFKKPFFQPAKLLLHASAFALERMRLFSLNFIFAYIRSQKNNFLPLAEQRNIEKSVDAYYRANPPVSCFLGKSRIIHRCCQTGQTGAFASSLAQGKKKPQSNDCGKRRAMKKASVFRSGDASPQKRSPCGP